MDETSITVTFGPATGDRAALSKSGRATLEALWRHPIAHNLEWSDMVALFETLGTVDHKPNNETVLRIGDEHLLVRRPHTKDVPVADIMACRHLLSRAGWSPQAPAHDTGATGPDPEVRGAPEVPAGPPDLLAVIDHHEARLYHLDLAAADLAQPVIRPYDPHHFLHHLAHRDQPREHGQRTPEDHAFYERIAQVLAPGGRIVLVGHGKGHSNAAHHLSDYLRQHHTETFRRLVREDVADISSLTAPQLQALGRRALGAGAAGSVARAGPE